MSEAPRARSRLRAVDDHEPHAADDHDDRFDVAAAVEAHPVLALGVALGAGALYAIASRVGRAKPGNALTAIALAAIASAATRMVRTFVLRAAVELWRAPRAAAGASAG